MNAVFMMTGTLAGNDGTEDVIITLDSHRFLIRLLSRGRRLLLLVPLGRPRASLATALRDICGFGAGLVTWRDEVA